MSNNDVIKKMRQTYSKVEVVGTLKEKKLEKVEEKFEDDRTSYSIIKGNIVLDVNGDEHKFRIYISDHFNSKNDNGKHKGNSDFEDFDSLMSCNLGTKLRLKCAVDRFNDYKSKKGNLVSIDTVNVKKVESVNIDTPDSFEGKIEGIIYRIEDEIVNEKETGRKIITFVGVGYDETALPHKLYVEEDIASAFESVYSVGDVCNVDVKFTMKRYGNVENSSSIGFAGATRAQLTSGYTKEEWIIFNGDPEPYNEDMIDKNGNSLYFTLDDIEPLMKKRSIHLEAIKQGNDSVVKGGLSEQEVVELKDEDIPF